MNIEAGQLVIYNPGYKQEIGRVKRLNSRSKGKAFVWYDEGDTASCTETRYLYPTNEQYAREHACDFENAYALNAIINKHE